MRSTKTSFERFSVLRNRPSVLGLAAIKKKEVEKMNFERLNKKQVNNWKRYEMRNLISEMRIKEIEVRKESY